MPKPEKKMSKLYITEKNEWAVVDQEWIPNGVHISIKITLDKKTRPKV